MKKLFIFLIMIGYLAADTLTQSQDVIHSLLTPFIGWGLNKLSLLHISSPTLAKLILSSLTFLFALSLGRVIVTGIFYIMNLFLHLSTKDKSIKKSICQGMIRPVIYISIAICIDIAIEILYYPEILPLKIRELFSLFYIGLATWFIIVLLKSYGTGLMGKAINTKQGMRKEAINLILKISYFAISVIGLLIALKEMGFNVSAILASLGIGGLAVAFALKDMLANFFASVMLLFENSFSQGDWIECNGIEGTVVEIGLRRTIIRTFENALISMPNITLSDKPITNWTRRKMGRRIKFSIGLTYDSPREEIKKVIEEIHAMLLSHPDIATDTQAIEFSDYELAFKQNVVSMEDFLGYKHNLYVGLDELADSSINILIYCYTKSIKKVEYMAAKQNVIFKIMEIVERHSLSFAFPSQSLYVESMPK